MKHIKNYGMLFSALFSGFLGGLLLRDIYKNFSIFDASNLFLLFVAGLGLITLGIQIGFHTFKHMKNS